jgi:HD-like signal output (HDOD) protein
VEGLSLALESGNPLAAIEAALIERISADKVRVPAYPGVALQVGKLLADDRASADRIGALVAGDPSLSAALLRRANSAAFARNGTVTSLQRAISVLGAREVQRVLFATSLGGWAAMQGVLSPVRDRVWRQAVTASTLSAALAERRGFTRDEGFLAGLLHDFGKVVALAALEDVLSSIPHPPVLSGAAWEAVVERFHTELGMIVAARWELPPLLAEAITGHHHPPAASSMPMLVELLQIVDCQTAQLETSMGISDDDLNSLPFLRPGDKDALRVAHQHLAATVASLMGTSRPRPTATNSMEADGRDGWRQVSFPVVMRDEGSLTFEARYVHPRGFVVSGPVGLTEGQLHFFELNVDGFVLLLWGHARLVVRDGPGWLVDVKVFGSSNEALAALNQMVASTQETNDNSTHH